MATDAESPKGTVWYDRDFPVLRAAVSLCQESDYSIAQTHEIAERSGIAQPEVVKAISNLQEHYLHAKPAHTLNSRDFLVTGATREGLIATDVWPSPNLMQERLIAAIELALEEAPVGSPKATKLGSLLTALRDVTTGTSGNVFGQLLTGAITGA